METIIWILKGFIALLFTYTGVSKLVFPKDKLLKRGMKGLVDLELYQIKGAGFLELLGVMGLILPSLLNIYPSLSGLAAIGLSLTMIVAGWIHYKLKDSIIGPSVIFVICIVIAVWELAYR